MSLTIKEQSEALQAASRERIPAAVAFLASDEASFIYGAVLPADGGRVAV
jgi:NAD(P)-dependent dehydrogenase (short-subunit alcohol dehydrogenase family)